MLVVCCVCGWYWMACTWMGSCKLSSDHYSLILGNLWSDWSQSRLIHRYGWNFITVTRAFPKIAIRVSKKWSWYSGDARKVPPRCQRIWNEGFQLIPTLSQKGNTCTWASAGKMNSISTIRALSQISLAMEPESLSLIALIWLQNSLFFSFFPLFFKNGFFAAFRWSKSSAHRCYTLAINSEKGKTRSGFIMDSCATTFFLISGHLSTMDWQVRLHAIQGHAYQIWSEYYSIIWLLDHRSGFYLPQMILASSVKWSCSWEVSIWNVNLKLLARSRMFNTITITIEQTNMGIGPNSHKNSGNEK